MDINNLNHIFNPHEKLESPDDRGFSKTRVRDQTRSQRFRGGGGENLERINPERTKPACISAAGQIGPGWQRWIKPKPPQQPDLRSHSKPSGQL